MQDALKKQVECFAAEIRLETFRALAHLGFGHMGGAMSMADALAVLYGAVMNIDPAAPQCEDRDWFVLSKGHSGPSLYAALALRGFFPLEKLETLNQNGTILPSHCSRLHTPGIDMTTGSLGQGASTAAGVAMASKVLGADNYIYLMLGDGECDEGQVWEMALFAAHHNLDNLIAFVDYNKKQLDGTTNDICALGDLTQKFRAFGWDAVFIDGHDVAAIYDAVQNAKEKKGLPSMIVLDTIKGKGCTLCENVIMNHHIMLPDAETNQKELARLTAEVERLRAQ